MTYFTLTFGAFAACASAVAAAAPSAGVGAAVDSKAA